MRALLIPADRSKDLEYVDIPMVDGYVCICDRMNWVFFDTVYLRTSLGVELDLVVDDNGIVNGAKINYRASMICSNYYKDVYPIFGDALMFLHVVNEYGDYDFLSIPDDFNLRVFVDKECEYVKL